jgi:hypothetical protein
MNRFPSIPWRLLCVVFVLSAGALGMRLHTLTEAVESAYGFNCTVIAVDANTFAPIRIVRSQGPDSHSADILKQTYTATLQEDGTLSIIGIAYEPRKFGIAAEGYSATELTITPDTKPKVEVLMKRLGGLAAK